MRKPLQLFSGVLVVCFVFYVVSCNNGTDKTATTTTPEAKAMTHDELVKRGDYIVTTGGCGDCHSPKLMTQMGPVPDSAKSLSGHPAGEPLPALSATAGEPGTWILMGPDLTQFVGPWGISYAANLTPDSATGIGSWTEEQFISTVRNGKHLGNGRPILPPMPWQVFAMKTDEDLKAIFAFLKSIPAISNRVPGPIAPPDLAKMLPKK